MFTLCDSNLNVQLRDQHTESLKAAFEAAGTRERRNNGHPAYQVC